MTFNVRLDIPSDSVNNWNYRKGDACRMIAYYSPDLLGMQEVLHNQMEDLKRGLPQYTALGVGRDDGKEAGEYCPIFFRTDRFTLVEYGNFSLSEQPKTIGIKGWDDLAGKTVITQTDSAAQDVLEGDQKDLAATFATLDTIGEYNTAFMQLESGAVDAVACDLSIAQYQLAAKPDAYTQLDEPLSSEHYAVGFKKGDTKSADAVAESLKALYEDGTVKDLCDKYSSYGLSFDNWVLK